MVKKPDIQYIDSFYVHGSEARVLELKPKRRLIKTVLPLAAPDKTIKLGIDPIQFGIMFVFNLGIGNMSPPFGIVLYQVIGLMGLRFSEVCKAIIPFLIIMLIVLAFIATCPGLILYIPNLLYG